jgi:hypothetical protein
MNTIMKMIMMMVLATMHGEKENEENEQGKFLNEEVTAAVKGRLLLFSPKPLALSSLGRAAWQRSRFCVGWG